MAFMFGGVKETAKPKDLADVKNKFEPIILNNLKSNEDYYIILLDNKPTQVEQALLIKSLANLHISSYIIVSSVNTAFNKDELHGGSIVDYITSHRSNWRSYLKYENNKCLAILAFGTALYSINGSADILTSDFYDDKMLYPYYYMGSEVYDYNTYIYPVDNLNEIYPTIENSYSTVNFKTRFFYAQIKRMLDKSSRTWTPDLTPVTFHTIQNKEDVDKLFKDNMKADLVSFDTETDGLKFYENHLHCLTITWNGVDGYFIPWKYVDVKLLGDNIKSCKRSTGANPKFDLKFMYYAGMDQSVKTTDTVDMLSHCLASDRAKGLKPLSYWYTCFGGYDNKLEKFKDETKSKNYSTMPDEMLSRYAIMDAICTYRVQKELWKQCDLIDSRYPNDKPLKDWTIRRWYETQTMKIYNIIVDVEYKGIYVDYDLMLKYRNIMLDLIKSKEKPLFDLWKLPPDFNLYSTSEIGKLFKKLGYPEHGVAKNGEYVTDENAMSAWIREGQPGVKELAELRTIKTTLNSFIGSINETTGKKTGWEQYITKWDLDNSVRIMQSYLVMGTETFRFIGKDPNFQNIPTRNEYAPYIKKCIDTPHDDLYVITSDSGKEYRLAKFELVYTQYGYKRADQLSARDTIVENDPNNPVVRRMEITKQPDGNFIVPGKAWFDNSEKDYTDVA